MTSDRRSTDEFFPAVRDRKLLLRFGHTTAFLAASAANADRSQPTPSNFDAAPHLVFTPSLTKRANKNLIVWLIVPCLRSDRFQGFIVPLYLPLFVLTTQYPTRTLVFWSLWNSRSSKRTWAEAGVARPSERGRKKICSPSKLANDPNQRA